MIRSTQAHQPVRGKKDLRHGAALILGLCIAACGGSGGGGGGWSVGIYDEEDDDGVSPVFNGNTITPGMRGNTARAAAWAAAWAADVRERGASATGPGNNCPVSSA